MILRAFEAPPPTTDVCTCRGQGYYRQHHLRADSTANGSEHGTLLLSAAIQLLCNDSPAICIRLQTRTSAEILVNTSAQGKLEKHKSCARNDRKTSQYRRAESQTRNGRGAHRARQGCVQFAKLLSSSFQLFLFAAFSIQPTSHGKLFSDTSFATP